MVESRRGESRRVQSSCNGIEDEKVKWIEVGRVKSSCNVKGKEEKVF